MLEYMMFYFKICPCSCTFHLFSDEELDKLEKVPCILHMDSIKGTHAGLKNLVQRYLEAFSSYYVLIL